MLNNVWNRINPWSACEQDLVILDPYNVGMLLLEMQCNTPDHSVANIKKQAVIEMKTKLQTAIEILNQNATAFSIYLFEENHSQDEYPDLYMEDDHGILSTHIKKLPYGGGGNILVSYRGYLREIGDSETKVPSWDSLADYFVNGEIV